ILGATGEPVRVAGIAEDVTDQARTQALLEDREAGLRRAQTLSKLSHVITGPDGSFESWSETLPELIGVGHSGMPPTTRSWLDILHQADRETFRNTCIEAGRRGVRTEIEYRLWRVDGVLIDVHQVMEPLPGFVTPDGKHRWFNTIQDITERNAQSKKIARLSRINSVLSAINSAIVRIHNREELFREACRIAVKEGAFGMVWIGLLDLATLEGSVVTWAGGAPGLVENIRLTARPGMPESNRPACMALREQRLVVCRDIQNEASLGPIRDELLLRGHRSMAALPLLVDGRAVGVIALYADVVGFFDDQELRLLDELAGDLSFALQFIGNREQLSYQAFYDPLTKLPNDRLFRDRLQLLIQANQSEHHVATILLNLNRFSHLNDALGRHAGDELLRQVAERLSSSLKDPCCAARIGSDTFAVAIPQLQHGSDSLTAFQGRILHVFQNPFSVSHQESHVSVRAGISLYPEDGHDVGTLIHHAEIALKRAKSSGLTYLYYAADMNTAIAKRLRLEIELRSAMAANQFEMHYQPRVDLTSGQIVGAEALIRWYHPQRGLVSPANFIPIAEETGLIVNIGEWVIDAVCAQLASWRGQQMDLVPVAINLSAVQFRNDGVIDTIEQAVNRHGIERHVVEFELTESAVMDNPEEAARHLNALKTLGMQLSLDDFGTGYSSLAYLKRFPFDFVKIDRAFITNITTDPEDAAIATAVVAMAHSLNLRVVAEGVETNGQLQFLRKLGCDEIQGYYFSKPVPAHEFAAMLKDGKCLPPADEAGSGGSTLLIVDDEPYNLSSLSRLLRRERYRILTATSAEEALEILASSVVQVIVSDQRMPGMSGSEFLAIVKELYPDTIRIILSGYTELSAVTDSVNRGAVFKFLTKPWDDALLRENIRDAFRRYRPSR
ncbi:MAG: EAL domain-containing protein, partial [Burkholderiaceae bacterium]|nr:EAL domain-containing protein [Burkholderiaceae bacterium]